MKRNILFVIMTCLTLAIAGCKYSDSCKDGPVAPDRESYEKSDIGDPQLPNPNVWWK